MKIAWLTPFDINSAIGRYSYYATQALSKYAQVVIFAKRTDNMLNTDLNTVFYDSITEIEKQLLECDVKIYNMGNFYDYHESIYECIKLYSGIVILHDATMFGFFSEYCNNKGKDFVSLLAKYYDVLEIKDVLRYLSSNVTRESVNMLDYNMILETVKNARGVVVHSKYHEALVKNVYDGKILATPLIKMCETNTNEVSSPYDNNMLNILTVGYVVPNKLIDKIIDAIGSSAFLQANVCYTVIGKTHDNTYLQKLLKMIKGLDKNIKLMGFMSDEEVERYYKHADIISNLRYPAYEGGSATLQEQLYYGKAVIVADTGIYQEMPDDCVIKIKLRNMTQDITNKLTEIVRDKSIISGISEKAREYAKLYFNEENYGNNFYGFMQKVNKYELCHNLMEEIKKELDFLGVYEKENEILQQTANNAAQAVAFLLDFEEQRSF